MPFNPASLLGSAIDTFDFSNIRGEPKPEVQNEVDYLGSGSQAEIDYLSRDSQAEIDYLGAASQAEMDYYAMS